MKYDFAIIMAREGLAPAEPMRSTIGSYELTEDEKTEVMRENERRGNLPLIKERNETRENARRKSES